MQQAQLLYGATLINNMESLNREIYSRRKRGTFRNVSKARLKYRHCTLVLIYLLFIGVETFNCSTRLSCLTTQSRSVASHCFEQHGNVCLLSLSTSSMTSSPRSERYLDNIRQIVLSIQPIVKLISNDTIGSRDNIDIWQQAIRFWYQNTSEFTGMDFHTKTLWATVCIFV